MWRRLYRLCARVTSIGPNVKHHACRVIAYGAQTATALTLLGVREGGMRPPAASQAGPSPSQGARPRHVDSEGQRRPARASALRQCSKGCAPQLCGLWSASDPRNRAWKTTVAGCSSAQGGRSAERPQQFCCNYAPEEIWADICEEVSPMPLKKHLPSGQSTKSQWC